MSVLIVCGLRREAEIAGGRAAVGGGGGARLRQAIEAAEREAPVSAVLSFGVAGALSPALRVGQVVAPAVATAPDGERFSVDPAWRAKLLAATGVLAVEAVAGCGDVVAAAADKARLHRATGACVVDMESHIAARAAMRLRVPFAVLRAVSDGADHVLPPAAAAGMGEDGGVDVLAVLAALARDPRQAPDLIRMARGASAAFNALMRVRAALGAGFGVHDVKARR